MAIYATMAIYASRMVSGEQQLFFGTNFHYDPTFPHYFYVGTSTPLQPIFFSDFCRVLTTAELRFTAF